MIIIFYYIYKKIYNFRKSFNKLVVKFFKSKKTLDFIYYINSSLKQFKIIEI